MKEKQKEPEVTLLITSEGHMVIVDVSGGPVSIYARDGNNVITQLKPLGVVNVETRQIIETAPERARRFLRLATLDGQEIGSAD